MNRNLAVQYSLSSRPQSSDPSSRYMSRNYLRSESGLLTGQSGDRPVRSSRLAVAVLAVDLPFRSISARCSIGTGRRWVSP